MTPQKTDISQENCSRLKASISALLKELAVNQKKKIFSFLAEASLDQTQREELEKTVSAAATISLLKENLLLLSNRLLRLVLVEAGTLPATESLESATREAQQKIEEAANASASTQLEALTKDFLGKYIHLEKEILAATTHIQALKKDPKELTSPENFYQKIIDAFSSPTQEQKKLEDQSHTIIRVATTLLEEQKKTSQQLFSTAPEFKLWSTFDHLLEQLQAFQKVEELLADLASSLIEQAFSQRKLIKEVKNRLPEIITALHQQDSLIGSAELTTLIEQFLKEYSELGEL